MAGTDAARRLTAPPQPMLFPSGEDANPLNRRLPAEVITRRRREVRKVEEKPLDEVVVDTKVALSLKPEARLKWLLKAMKMLEENRASGTDLYDIVANRKFASGMPYRIGKKARAVVIENLALFSDKQQRYLKSEDWPLNMNFPDDGRDDDGAPILPVPPPPSGLPPSAPSTAASPGLSSKDVRDGTPQAGVWMVAEDSSARQRQQALERAKREAQELKMREQLEGQKREEQDRQSLLEAEEARRRALENEVDSSLMLLERLGSKSAEPPSRSSRDRRDRHEVYDDRRRGRRNGLSRSRSISAVGSASSDRGVKRKRSRSRGKKKDKKVSFEDALKRRMQEREYEVDSSRIPVVDPGHSKRWK